MFFSGRIIQCPMVEISWDTKKEIHPIIYVFMKSMIINGILPVLQHFQAQLNSVIILD